LSESRPPTGSAVERLKGKASEIPLVDLEGTGRGGLKVLAFACMKRRGCFERRPG